MGEILKGNLNILSSYTIKSKGIRKGLIVDPNLAINSIKDGIKEVNNLLGISVRKAIVNVPDYNSKFMFVTGEVNIVDEDELVTTESVNKVIKDSVYAKLAQDYELITVVPLTFLVDGEQTSHPIGKSGKKTRA